MKTRLQELEQAHDSLSQRLIALESRLRQLEQDGSQVLTQEEPAKERGIAVPLLSGPTAGSDKIQQAAWELENSCFNQVVDKYPKDLAGARQHYLELLHANVWHSRAIMGLIVLTFMEVPAWCHADGGAGSNWSWEPGPSRCTVEGTGAPLLSGVPYLPPGWAFVVEIICEVLILRKFMLEYTLESKHFMPLEVAYHQVVYTKYGFIFAIGSIVDTLVFLVYRNPFRFTFIFRTGLIFLMPHIRHLFFNIFNRRVLAEFASVAIFFVGTMVFFSFIGVTLFQSDEEVVYKEGEEVVRVNEGMEDFSTAIYSMFVGGVTGDFLESFLPTFLHNHAAGLLWALYLVLTQVLLKNLVMDTLISQYLKGVQEETDVTMRVQATGMLASFQLLSEGKDSVPAADFEAFVAQLRQSPAWQALPDGMASLLQKEVKEVTRENFCDVCMVLRNQSWVTAANSPLNLQDDPEYEWLTKWVREPEELPGFDKFMNKVLLLNLTMVVLESTYDVMGWDEPAWMDYVEFVFAFAYLGEVAVKLSVKSFGEYWSSAANQFDFFTTWLLLTTALLPYLPIPAVEADLSHYANILRLLRLIRILKQLKQFPSVQFMVYTITRIVTAAETILSLMGTLMFFFSNLAVNLFGGLLYEGNPDLEGTEYAENHWFVLNFNDMFGAFAAWFCQVLCEYVPAYAQALGAASSWGSVAWWIVVAFYITTAAIMYELLLAFTIDVYLQVKSQAFHEEEEEEEKEKEGEEEEEGEEEAEEEEEGEKGEATPQTPKAFFTKMERVMAKSDQGLHFRSKYDNVVLKEFREAYGEAIEKKSKVEPFASDQEAVCKAAWLLEDGLDGIFVSKYPEDIVTARALHMRVIRATAMHNKAIMALVALTLMEVPAWCHSSPTTAGFWQMVPGSEWCVAPPGGNLHLSGVWYLPPGLALVAEFIIEFVILRKFMLERQLERVHFEPVGTHYHTRQVTTLGCIFSVASIVDTAIFVAFKYPLRFTFIFRTGLLCLLPGVRSLSGRIFNRKMMGEFLFVALFFIITVLLFAWITFTVFAGLDDISYVKGETTVRVNTGFETLRNTIYTMFLAGITEGFVDIFMPSMTVYRGAMVLWFVFLLLTQVLLLNLVIDAFVAAYLEGSEKRGEQLAENRAAATVGAYDILATLEPGRSLPNKTLLRFMDELAQSPRILPIEKSSAEAMLADFGRVNRKNFCDLCPLLQNVVWVTKRNSFLETEHPEIWSSEWFKELRKVVWEPAENPVIDDVMNWVLLFNLVLIVAEFCAGNNLPTWMRITDLLFTLAYVGEVLLKLAVKSWGEYWSFPANRFDFFTTVLLLSATILKHLPIAAVRKDLAHYANILRLLRLLRVVKKLKQYPSFQFMVGTMCTMAEAAGEILSLLGVVLFFFMTVSVNFFGGDLYEGNEKLKGHDYEAKHWFVFNFNDSIMAIGTWFFLLLDEYSAELADALYVTAHDGEVAWLIFPAFYLIGVAILFELLQAFTIETFLGLKEQAESESGKENEFDFFESESSSEAGNDEAKKLRMPAMLEGMQAQLQEKGQILHLVPSESDDFWQKLRSAYVKMSEGSQ